MSRTIYHKVQNRTIQGITGNISLISCHEKVAWLEGRKHKWTHELES